MLLVSGYAIRCGQYTERATSIDYDIYKVAERGAVDWARPLLALYEKDIGEHPEATISLLVGDGYVNFLRTVVIKRISLHVTAGNGLK